jgi:uncharacterized protein (TIGR03067 family)
MCRMLFLLGGFLLVVMRTAGSEEPQGDPAKEDMKKLQGRWQVIRFIDSSEKAAPPDEIQYFTFEFKGDVLIIRKNKDDGGRDAGKCKLNPSKEPKWFDLDVGLPELLSEGIYKLEGD